MKEYSIERTRNISLLAHGQVGKTSLIEAMLFSAGETTRLGKVDDGTTVTDYIQDEIDRKISISTALALAEWQKHKLNIIDTPGFSDFVGAVICGLRVVESVVVLVSATAGVEVGTEAVWKLAKNNKLAAFFFVNRMDKEHADFDQAVENMRDRCGSSLVPIQFPANSGENFDSVVDLIKMKVITYQNDLSGKYTEKDIPANLMEKAQELRKKLEESIAENDETLMEKYLETEKLDDKELVEGLRREVIKRNIVPVLCGAASSNKGIARLMDAIVDFAPSPLDVPPVVGLKPDSTTEVVRKSDAKEPLCALVFKTIAEQHLGELSFFRVFSGNLEAGMEIYNSSVSNSEKLSQVFFMNGKTRKEAGVVSAGDIGATVKLKNTKTGDTLCDKKNLIVLPKIDFPEAIIRTALVAKNKGDEEKISAGLHSIHGEDPTITFLYDPEIKQLVMSGQGELQFDIVAKRLKDKYSAEVEMVEPRIPYRETIRKKVEAQGKYKKQSGGRGQYGDCHLRIEPQPHGAGFEFLDEVVGGVIPGKYIPAIEKGVRETMVDGVIAGYPVVDLKVAVFYGSYHAVDSSDMAFKVAGSMAFKKAFNDASPVLLEPIYNLEVTVPEECMGDVMGDISSRRGKILGMEAEGPFQTIKAKVPLAELYKYSTSLRSLTQGRGIHRRNFSHYEEVPGEVQAKIVEASQKTKKDEEE